MPSHVFAAFTDGGALAVRPPMRTRHLAWTTGLLLAAALAHAQGTPPSTTARPQAPRQTRDPCERLTAAVRARPKDAARHLDLATCLGNLDRASEAVDAAYRAVQLAGPAASKVRLSAYALFFRFGARATGADCALRYASHTEQGELFGGLYVRSSVQRIAADEAHARFTVTRTDEWTLPAELPSSPDAFEGPWPASDHLDLPCYESGWTGQALGAVPPSDEELAMRERDTTPMSRCCTLVYENACTGRLGVVCAGAERRDATAFEARLPPLTASSSRKVSR